MKRIHSECELSAEYQNGPPIIVALSSRTELRIVESKQLDNGEQAFDLRRWTIDGGGTATPHRQGIRLSRDEVKCLRQTLNDMEL